MESSYQGEEAFVGIGLSGEVVEGEEIIIGAIWGFSVSVIYLAIPLIGWFGGFKKFLPQMVEDSIRLLFNV
jgi:hypothetical protein